MTEYVRKVVVLGDPMVGKTSLVKRFVYNMFDDKYLSTIGAKPSKKVVHAGSNKITMLVWDLAGHSHNQHSGFYAGAKGALAVCDLTQIGSIDSLEGWQMALAKEVGDVPLIILANKCDLPYNKSSLERLNRLKYPVIQTSAKTGQNVESAFKILAEALVHE